MTNRRDFIQKTFLAGIGASFTLALPAATCLSPESQKPKHINSHQYTSLEGKKVLVVLGGWEGHKPAEAANKFIPWLKEKGADIQIFETLDVYKDESIMNKIDVVVQCWTMGEINEEQEKGLLKAIKNGTGIAGWHGGLCDAFRKNIDYQLMTGGQFLCHPGGENTEYEVHIKDKKDSVMKGIKDFKITTEQYYMLIDPNVKVLATSTFNKKGTDHEWLDGSVMPQVWKKMYGKGRVFFCSLGHSPTVFDMPEPLEIMKRGIEWASKSKYEKTENLVNPVYKD